MTDVQNDQAIHHEGSDVNVGGLFAFALGLAITLGFVAFVVWVLFSFYAVRAGRKTSPAFPLAAQQENRVPPEPRLQTNPREDLNDLRTRENEILGSYGWIDKNAGVARIPIDQAMKLTLQRGLPTRQAQK